MVLEKSYIINLLLLSILLSVTHCGNFPVELTTQEMINWVQNKNNGLIQTKEIGDIGFTVKYKPTDYLIARDILNGYDSDNYDTLKKKYDGLEFVDIKIYPTDPLIGDLMKYNASSIQDYQSKVYYYSFTFQDDIKLIRNGQENPCVLFNFARDHGLSPELNFVLAFERTNLNGDTKIQVNDKVFGNGLINFIIKSKDIKNLPSLKIK